MSENARELHESDSDNRHRADESDNRHRADESDNKHISDGSDNKHIPNNSHKPVESDKEYNKRNSEKFKQLGAARFANEGTWCYFNSINHILQQLYPLVTYMVLNYKKIIDDPNDYSIIKALSELFKKSFDNDKKIITPRRFKMICGKVDDTWNDNNHQDSHEYLNFIITKMNENPGIKCKFIPGFDIKPSENIGLEESFDKIIGALNKNHFEQSKLTNKFSGLLGYNYICAVCGKITKNYDPFNIISVPIPVKNNKDNISIYDCLDNMTKKSQLDKKNKRYCGLCGVENQSYSSCQFQNTPQVLIIHLIRFRNNLKKIKNNVEYPKILDLSKYFNPHSPDKNKSKYNLIGVNIHQSIGRDSNINLGHYTSIVKDKNNGKWFLYNDSCEPELKSSKDVQSSNAYILFYVRVKRK